MYLDLEAGQTTMGVGSYVQYFVRAIPDEIHAALAVLSVQATIIHAARVEGVLLRSHSPLESEGAQACLRTQYDHSYISSIVCNNSARLPPCAVTCSKGHEAA